MLRNLLDFENLIHCKLLFSRGSKVTSFWRAGGAREAKRCHLATGTGFEMTPFCSPAHSPARQKDVTSNPKKIKFTLYLNFMSRGKHSSDGKDKGRLIRKIVSMVFISGSIACDRGGVVRPDFQVTRTRRLFSKALREGVLRCMLTNFNTFSGAFC